MAYIYLYSATSGADLREFTSPLVLVKDLTPGISVTCGRLASLPVWPDAGWAHLSGYCVSQVCTWYTVVTGGLHTLQNAV